MKTFLIVLLLLPTLTLSNPLLNINTENSHVYFSRDSSPLIKGDITTIKPLNLYRTFGYTLYEERIKPYSYIDKEKGFYIKPLSELDFKVFYTDTDYTFLEGTSGIKLYKGFNGFLYYDGFFSLGRKSLIYYQIRHTYRNSTYESDINRLYGKFLIGKFSIQLGKDNVNLGPGEYGLLLSNNVEPYPLLKIQTEQPLKKWGYWDLIFVRGWMIEKRQDRNNPSLLALRLVWKPSDFIEIGVTKTTLYEGEGRPSYRIEEYPELILSTRDNIPGDRYDNSSNAGYDISLYLPLGKLIPSVELFKIYFQEAASDVIAFWQVEDRGRFYPPFGIRFLKPAYQFGFLVSTRKNALRFEVAKVSENFFIHHYYQVEGHSYKNLSLGYPYGRNSLSVLLKHRHYIKDSLFIEYKIGGVRQPFEGESKYSENFFIQILTSYTYDRIKGSLFIKANKTNNHDEDTLPHLYRITNKEKLFFIFGIGVTIII